MWRVLACGVVECGVVELILYVVYYVWEIH